MSHLPLDQCKEPIFNQVGLSDLSKQAFDKAVEEGKRFGSHEFTPEHLFLGALRVSIEIQEILKSHGLVVDYLRQKLIEMLDEPPPRP